MPATLTPADVKILNALQNDGRLSNQALSEEVGMSTSPCWRRVRQLEDDGVIQGYMAVLNRREIGLGVLAFIRVKIDSHTEAEADAFAEEVMKLDSVVACYSIAGDADFLLQVVSADLDSYSDFAMKVVRRLPCIKEMQTTFVLKEIKAYGGLPLRASAGQR